MNTSHRSIKKRKGRPRKDGKPPRVISKKLPLAVRRGIKKMLDEKKTFAQIKLRYARYRPTDHQVRDVKYGRVKLVATPRRDAYDSPTQTEKIRRSSDPIHMLREGLIDALNDLDGRPGYKPEDRIDMLTKASLVNQRVTAASLVTAMGRRDAEVILAIVRLYEPNATEDDAIRIYKQAVEIAGRKE